MEDSATSKMDRAVDWIDGIQMRVPALAVAVGVTKKYGEDEGGQLAMLIAYKGFFSIVPLLLALVNVLGLALRNNPSLRATIVDSTFANIPVVGSQLAAGAEELTGSWLILIVSAAVSVWAGLGLLGVIGQALNRIWDVAVYERPAWFFKQLRCVGAAAIVGFFAVISGGGRWVVTTDVSPLVRVVAGAVFPLLAGAGAYLGLHISLCVRRVALRSQVPGMVATAVSWWALFSLGGYYIERVVNRSSDTYGAFAVVLGLLSWSYLLGMLYLYSATLAAVMLGRRWPRGLSERNLTVADREAIEATLRREVAISGVSVEVTLPSRSPGPG